jgi:hypothetical protein
MQFLCTGHIERGIECLGELLAEIGETLPRSKVRAIARVLFERARVKLSGLGFTERMEADIPEPALARLDVYRVVGETFTTVDTLWGAPYSARAFALSLKIGERRRIARAVFYQALYHAAEGKPARALAMLARANEIARPTDDPHLHAFAAWGEGTVRFFAGEFPRARQLLADGETLLVGLPGATLDRNSVRLFRLNVLWTSGHLREVDRLTQEYLQDARRRDDRFAESTYRRFTEASAFLARDQPEAVEPLLAEVRWVPPAIGFHIQHWYELWTRCLLACYRQDSGAALAPLQARLTEFSRTFLFFGVQRLRVITRWLEAAILLSDRSAQAAPARSAQVRLARLARKLEGERAGYATLFATLIRAALAHGNGDDDGAITQLRHAIEAAHGQDLYVAAASWRLGELVGGDGGQVLVARAVDAFRGQDVACPDRYINLYTPGFARPGQAGGAAGAS